MPRPRKALVSKSTTPYYHCVSRCVRRAFLCGQDYQTGKCYEHRRGWLVERIHLLSSLFTIDVCAFAVMNNHYHIVVRIGSSEDLSDEEVIRRWLCLYKGPLLVHCALKGDPLTLGQQETLASIVSLWRNRLQDLSWFMKCLNEPIARQANREDRCTGHFWESRFKSQALYGQEALLACMAYVDLNPIRANIAKTPETSDYTSIKERVSKPNPQLTDALLKVLGTIPIKPLQPFIDTASTDDEATITCAFSDYLELVDWTGRIVKKKKTGFIPNDLPPILRRLDISSADWLLSSCNFEKVIHKRYRKTA